ncbi:MAG: response regulator transcription factor, partial [Streptosporangiaceae bacterium]
MRAVIADDSVLLREGIARLLAEGDIEVVAGVGDGDSLLAAVETHKPDLAVIDVRMPPGHRDEGLRAAIEIRRRWPDVALLVLSQFVEERYATELLAGDTRAIGYLLKDRVADVAEFIEALHRVAGGGTALDPEVVRQLLAR